MAHIVDEFSLAPSRQVDVTNKNIARILVARIAAALQPPLVVSLPWVAV